MINCDKTKILMSDFIENDIESDAKENVEQHLSICPACKIFFEKTKRMILMMSNMTPHTVSSDFDGKLMSRIESGQLTVSNGRTNNFFKGAAVGAAEAGLLFVTLNTDDTSAPKQDGFSKSAVNSDMLPSTAVIDSSASDSLTTNKDLLNQVDQNLKMVTDRK